MSGTELSRVRTEFRLRPPEPINQSHRSRGADIVMKSNGIGNRHLSDYRVYQELTLKPPVFVDLLSNKT
jgi:hypothetical protein